MSHIMFFRLTNLLSAIFVSFKDIVNLPILNLKGDIYAISGDFYDI